jgi:hypothetical protein
MRAIEIDRDGDGKYPASEIVERFQKHGLVVLKQFLPADSRAALRTLLEQRLERARRTSAVSTLAEYPNADFLLGDILAIRELEPFDYIFLRTELLEAARAILNTTELLYWGDSSVQFGEGGRGFHKDNVERHDASHDDWKGDYALIRCGFYCQDHAHHSGGLKVRLGSHNIANHLDGKMLDVPSSYGDLVVWNMRLTHSGNNRKLRGAPSITLHPRLEAIAPPWLTIPEEMRRISAFCSRARPGLQTERYVEKMNRRESDYGPYFRRARRPRESTEILQRRGVTFLKPNSYYGELDRDAN